MPPKSPLDTKPARLPFFTPDEWPVDLFFFRKCFVRLLERSKSNGEEVPVAHFQKGIKRLFKILGDEEKGRSFDATEYDPDGSKTIGWSEFCECWKNNKITIKLSVRERIHLIFDPVGSSQCSLAKWVSYLILAIIFVSAISFVCGTMEAFKETPKDCNICRGDGHDVPIECLCEPKPMEFFKYIEMVCIIVFTSEYVIKLLTAHAMRTELTRHNDLLELVCGEFPIKAQSGMGRTWKFLREPSNVIDVLAILPYFVERHLTEMNFNLTFLRLIRLTRIFRIVRLGKMSDAADMLVETLTRSAPSLYVLGFCIVLGIVVCSSIVYFCESGDWDREQKAFIRKDIFGDKETTPFTSIPATLWWTVVTVTTVGYGDMYPTSTLGKITGSLTIVAGVIAFAMPIGVISSNFGNVWDAREESMEREEKERLKEEEAIIEALGFIGQERTAVILEVYDDDGVEKLKSKPQFLGEVSIDISALNFSNDKPGCVKMQLPLEDNKAKANVSVTGVLYGQITWMPDSCLDQADDGTSKPRNGVEPPTPFMISAPPEPPETSIWEGMHIPQLVGQFSVAVQNATGLLNLDSRLSGLAHPFCRVTVYTHFNEECRDPMRPRDSQGVFPPNEVKQPVVWQTKTIHDTMDPVWQETKTFNFDWRDATGKPKKKKKKVDGEDLVQDAMDMSPDQKIEDVESFALSFPAERVALLQAEAKKWKEAFEALHKEVKGVPPPPIGPGSRRVKATRKVQQIVEKEERDGFDGQGCSSTN
eukprot:gnl/MRDRNA2_/MRDRNA2_99140_c0_seq1.p1 gnl/MRDRNA2_/MRDRNA2_99140_c0~~gnl/MRDRNA2_/MRDRNA2_99140_c0_seq1.p1  ORF type:complete len:760 (-),score=139.95 gnl/MRDRNA2_/MRDRNA2_99140_c0_seq1:100-2379(-)